MKIGLIDVDNREQLSGALTVLNSILKVSNSQQKI